MDFWIPVVLITFKLVVFGVGMFFSIKWHHDQAKEEKSEARGAQTSAEHASDASD